MGKAELARAHFLGIPFVAEPPEVVVNYLLSQISQHSAKRLPVHLIPVHAVAETASDPEFFKALNGEGIVVPDGRWLELLTRKSDKPLRQLRGTDLFERVCEAGVATGTRHYFLGSSTDLLAKLSEGLTSRFPGIVIAGSEPYPFGELTHDEKKAMVERITEANADAVWFGISTPRQNKEAIWLSDALGRPVVCVGAALEFFAGAKKMAPRWVQRAGVEWLYRFASEPSRLWRRYVFGSLTFLRLYLTRTKSN